MIMNIKYQTTSKQMQATFPYKIYMFYRKYLIISHVYYIKFNSISAKELTNEKNI